MGKHERQSIKRAEEVITKILNSENLSNGDKKNHWFKHIVTIADRIKNDFRRINSVRHLGDSYDTIGDIKLIFSSNKDIFIETKMSDTKLGVGTKANISQDALTENFLFNRNVKSWSKFRKERNHEKWVIEYLNQFSKYPARIKNISNLVKQKEEKARFLRNFKKGNKKAKEILNAIHDKDKKEKLNYLNYLKNQGQNPEMIKRFLILIILGIHTKKTISDLIKKKDFFAEIKKLYIYYANHSDGKIKVKREDAAKKVKEILEKYRKFKIIFPEGLTHCRIVGIKNKKAKPLLQVVLHWKNIAQGIKTPCLNIFDLTI